MRDLECSNTHPFGVPAMSGKSLLILPTELGYPAILSIITACYEIIHRGIETQGSQGQLVHDSILLLLSVCTLPV